MTNDQETRLKMDIETINVCDANPTVINSIPPLVPIYAAFKGIVQQISDASIAQSADIKGFAIAKKEKKKLIADNAFDICNKIVASTVVNPDPILEQKINFTLYDFMNATDIELFDHANVVHATAITVLADIGTPNDFNINQPQIDDLHTAIVAYNHLIADPRNAIVTRHITTAALKQLFKEAEATLKKMDKLIAILNLTNPEFVAKYKSARTLVGPGHQEISIMGTVYDAVTHIPIEKATVEVIEANTKVTTTIKGTYRFKYLTGRTYTISASAPDYKKQIALNIPVQHNLPSVFNIKLERGETRYEILPNSEFIPWHGSTDNPLKIKITNTTTLPCQLWIYGTELAGDSMQVNKIILNAGESNTFNVSDFLPMEHLYIHLFNPSQTVTVQYMIELSAILQ